MICYKEVIMIMWWWDHLIDILKFESLEFIQNDLMTKKPTDGFDYSMFDNLKV